MTQTTSTPDVAAAIVDEVEKLVRLEVELARQEMKELAITNGIAAGSFVGAANLALTALLVGIPVLIVVAVEPHWLAALIWVVAYLLIAAGLALYGRAKLKVGPPERTLSTLKETRDWALRQMRSPGR